MTVSEEATPVTSTEDAADVAIDESTWCDSTDDSDHLNLAQARYFDAHAADDYVAMAAELENMLAAAGTAPPRSYCVVIALNVSADEAAAEQQEALVNRIRQWQDEHDQRSD